MVKDKGMSRLGMILIGILFLIGGAFILYLMFFDPFLFFGGLAYSGSSGIWFIILPFFLILLGSAAVYSGIKGEIPKEKKIEEAPLQSSTLQQPLPPPPPPSFTVVKCLTCGQQLTFIQQYGRWYCYNCKKYP